MAQSEINQRLTTLDASFLNFEKKEAPLHIAGIYVFEGEIPFENFMRLLDAKLPMLPRYLQKVVPAPFNVGHPTWEFDPAFDLKNHVFHLQLEQPGTLEQLKELAARILGRMLDRSKPLWEIYLISGFEGGNSAMVSKVHHAMVDGISGVDLMKIVFDITPDETIPPRMESPVRPVTRSTDLTRRYIDSFLSNVEERLKNWTEFQKSLLNLAEAFIQAPPATRTGVTSAALPAIAAPVSLLPFNRANSGQIKLAWNEFSFAEARAIRANIGGTVNDVVLTVLSGAVIRYLELHRLPTAERTLRLMVPVSMRREDQRGALGNLVSVLPIEIPLDIQDPLERYAYINKRTGVMKEARVSEGVNMVTALLGTVPAWLQALVGSVSTFGDLPIPIFNMVCTNVPGPQIPLYALGRRMLRSYPFVPIAATVGASCAIFSYDQRLFFGVTADATAMPDVDQLEKFLEASFAELRAAAGVPAPATPKKEAGKVETPAESKKSSGTRPRKPRKTQPV